MQGKTLSSRMRLTVWMKITPRQRDKSRSVSVSGFCNIKFEPLPREDNVFPYVSIYVLI